MGSKWAAGGGVIWRYWPGSVVSSHQPGAKESLRSGFGPNRLSRPHLRPVDSAIVSSLSFPCLLQAGFPSSWGFSEEISPVWQPGWGSKGLCGGALEQKLLEVRSPPASAHHPGQDWRPAAPPFCWQLPRGCAHFTSAGLLPLKFLSHPFLDCGLG